MSLLHRYDFFIYLGLCFLCFLLSSLYSLPHLNLKLHFIHGYTFLSFLSSWKFYFNFRIHVYSTIKKQCSCDLYNLFSILMLCSCFVLSFILVHCFEGYWTILGSGQRDIVFFLSPLIVYYLESVVLEVSTDQGQSLCLAGMRSSTLTL